MSVPNFIAIHLNLFPYLLFHAVSVTKMCQNGTEMPSESVNKDIMIVKLCNYILFSYHIVHYSGFIVIFITCTTCQQHANNLITLEPMVSRCTQIHESYVLWQNKRQHDSRHAHIKF